MLLTMLAKTLNLYILFVKNCYLKRKKKSSIIIFHCALLHQWLLVKKGAGPRLCDAPSCEGNVRIMGHTMRNFLANFIIIICFGAARLK